MKTRIKLGSIHFLNDPRFVIAIHESLTLYQKLKKIKQNSMNTQSTDYPYPIKNLVSMTDFISLVNDFELIKRYGEFLKQPLKLETLIPINGDDAVLFKDFRIDSEGQLRIDFVPSYLGEIICLTNGKMTVPFFPKQRYLVEFLTIVDAVYANDLLAPARENDPPKIELTDTALKQIFGHDSY